MLLVLCLLKNLFTRSSPVLYSEYCIQDGNLDACPVVHIPRGVLVLEWIRIDTCCGRANSIWIRIRVNAEIFNFWTKLTIFLKVSRCSRAKQRQINVQKSVLHVQSCFLLIRPWRYTGRFATTIFSPTQRCNIVATLFQMVATLF